MVFGPCTVATGDLPVMLAVEAPARAASGLPPLALFATRDVLHVLVHHRLHELRSTGRPLHYWASLHAVDEGRWARVGSAGILAIMPVRARHAETCYGLLVGCAPSVHDVAAMAAVPCSTAPLIRPLLGWTVGVLGCGQCSMHVFPSKQQGVGKGTGLHEVQLQLRPCVRVCT